MLRRILVFFGFTLLSYKRRTLDLLGILVVLGFIVLSFLLSWLGQCLMEYPYILVRVYASFIYFFLVVLLFCVWCLGELFL
jgi:hypothetical protein